MKFKDDVKLDPYQVEDRRGWQPPADKRARVPKGAAMAVSPISKGSLLDHLRNRVARKRIIEAVDPVNKSLRGMLGQEGIGAILNGTTPGTIRDLLGPSAAPLPALAPVADTAAGGGAAPSMSAGPAPDLAAYVTPFDQAEKRSREAYAAALPTISGAYDQLRSQLSSGQSEFAQVQARLAAENAARQVQAQQQMAALQAPAQADLAAAAGGDPVASLTGALAAQANQQQANSVDQASRQNSLAAEFARQQAASGQSRLADSQLAQQAAASNAQVNLNDILNQLGVQKAAAQRQYAGDTADFNRQSASMAASQAKASGSSGNPALDEINMALKQAQLQKALAGLEPKPPTKRALLEQHLAAPQPGKGRAKALFERILTESPDRKTAYSGLAAFMAGNEAFGNAKKPGTYQGAHISPTVIRKWIDDWFATN